MLTAGAALEQPNGSSELELPPMPPGVQFVVMLASLRNVSPQPLRIKTIETIDVGGENAAVVDEVRLAEYPGEPSEASIFPGFYLGEPVIMQWGSCISKTTHDAAGYLLAPSRTSSERVLMVMRFRTAAEGDYRVVGERVMYEQDGKSYFQEIPFAVVGEVKDGARVDVRAEQRGCWRP